MLILMTVLFYSASYTTCPPHMNGMQVLMQDRTSLPNEAMDPRWWYWKALASMCSTPPFLPASFSAFARYFPCCSATCSRGHPVYCQGGRHIY